MAVVSRGGWAVLRVVVAPRRAAQGLKTWAEWHTRKRVPGREVPLRGLGFASPLAIGCLSGTGGHLYLRRNWMVTVWPLGPPGVKAMLPS